VIDDTDHPEMLKALRQLEARCRLFHGRPMTGRLVHELFGAIKDHRERWRKRGVDFPVLVPLICERDGTIDLKRADLDVIGIRTVVRNYVIEHPNLSPYEIAAAVKIAWPDLKPGTLADEAQLNRIRMSRSLVRQGVDNLPKELVPVAEKEA